VENLIKKKGEREREEEKRERRYANSNEKGKTLPLLPKKGNPTEKENGNSIFDRGWKRYRPLP